MKTSGVTLEKLKSAPNGAFLYCDICASKNSATYGDYSFWMPDDKAFKCCKVNMRLVVEKIELIEIK